MTFFSFVSGLYVMVFLMGMIFISLFIFMMSKLFAKRRFEFNTIASRTFLGSITGLVIFAAICYTQFSEIGENASAAEKEEQLEWISGMRYLLLFVPLLCGFIYAVIPVMKSNLKNE